MILLSPNLLVIMVRKVRIIDENYVGFFPDNGRFCVIHQKHKRNKK